jgi:amino acid adenylation domain-containing protein
MFVNTIALRIALNRNSTIKELLKIVRKTTIEAFEHQDYPFEELVEHLAVKRNLSRNPIFDVMFNLLNYADYSEDLMVLEGVKQKHTPGISKFDLTLSAVDYGDQFLMNFEYSTQLFREETIDRLIACFQQLLKNLPDILEERVSEVEIISENEKFLLLHEFNNTKSNYPKDQAIHQLFEEQVLRTPDKIVVTRNDVQVTYKELSDKSNYLSLRLVEEGVQQGSIVGLMCGRTVEMLIGMLSILKSGCIYLPIDADYPLARKRYMINDSGLKLVLTDMEQDNEIEMLCEILRVPENQQELSIKKLPIQNNNPDAYIMYTSGSTGLPKGVLVRHEGVVRLVKNSNYAPLTEETVILQTGAIVFDATTFEVWGALLNGGKLILVDKEEISNATQLGMSLCKQNVNTLWLSSALFNQLVQDEPKIFRTVKWLLVGGDIVSPIHVKKAKFNNPEINIVNGYGPTENTTFSTTYLISDTESTSIPIGSPIANSTCFIFSDENRIQPIGVSGELCVGGNGLSEGYLNNPELTHEKFIENPFIYGDRLYRTGDLTRRLSNGNIEFLGRKDNQMKIRGFRIESGEIESVLLKHDKVKECIVLVHEKAKEKFLCAYVVLINAGEFSLQSLREYMIGLLPEYMIPSFFVLIDKIPLTPNGKLDREALPLPEITAGLDFVTPSNEVEEQLVNIWSEVLQIPRGSISVTNNFFAIGGHSLRASTCISKMRKVFNADIPLVEIFRNPTITQLASIISTSRINEYINNTILLKEGKKNGENLFLIHDGSGDVDGYIELCQHANDEMNYWGIKATGFKRLETYNITIEQIAQEYMKSMRRVQTSGEYRIMGWSLGGAIALEIARLLEQSNCRVSFLGIIDSIPPRGLEDFYKPEFTVKSEIEWLKQFVNNQNIFKDLDDVKDLGQLWLKAVDLIKHSGVSEEIVKRGLMGVVGYSIKDQETLPVDELTSYMNFTRTLLRACSNYIPYRPILSRITYFRASDSGVENPQSWLNYSKNKGTIHSIEGDHFTILKQPSVFKLYDELMKSLKMEKEMISAN